jgi:outer membrane lipoprotein-sorting protein
MTLAFFLRSNFIMSKYFRFILPAIAIAFLFSAAASEASAQDVLRKILKRMDDNNKSLISLKSNIKMEKRDSVLNETDLSEGSLSYLPGRSQKQIYVRIDWAKPIVEHLAVANGEYVLYRPKAKQAIVGKVDGAKNSAKTGGALAFMTMSKAELSANYKVDYLGDETVSGGVNTFHLKLTPIKATTYKSADLWVDGNGMPVQAKVVEKNNDTTTILLSNVQRNATIKASDFKIDPPRDVKIVRG